MHWRWVLCRMYIINFSENAVAENAVGVCVSDNELAIYTHYENCHSLTDAQWLMLVGNQYLSIACSNRIIIIVVPSSSS